MMNSDCGNELRKPKTRLYKHLTELGVFEYPVEDIRDGSPIYSKNLEVKRRFSPFYVDPTTQELVFVGGVPLTFEDYINEDLRSTIATDYSMNFSENTKIVSFIYPKYGRPYVEFNEEVLEKLERFGYAYLTPIVPPQEEDINPELPEDFLEEFTPNLEVTESDLKLQEKTLDNVKSGVTDLFNAKPVLASIGTPQQYSAWLNYLLTKGKLKGTQVTEILYHGSDKEFDVFDKSKRGTSTGDGYFKDEEQTPIDSLNAFFFSTDPAVSEQYGLLRRLTQIRNITSILGAGLTNPARFKELRNYSPEFADHLKQKKEELTREELLSYIKNLYLRYRKVDDELGTGFLNQYNNYTRLGKQIKDLQNKKADILSGSYVHNSFTKEYPQLGISLYEDKKGIGTYITNTGEINHGKFNNRNITELTEAEFDELIDIATESHQEGLNEINNKLTKAKITPTLYRVLLNVQRPLVKDFENKPFVNQAYSEGAQYEASKLTNEAAKSQGQYDSVIFKNILDPYLSDNYGVFEPEQVYILGGKEDTEEFKKFVSLEKLAGEIYPLSYEISEQERQARFEDFLKDNQNISRDDAEDYFNQCMI